MLKNIFKKILPKFLVLFSNIHIIPFKKYSLSEIRSKIKGTKNIFIADEHYFSCSKKEMECFLKTYLIQHKKWTKSFDCDNFSDLLFAYRLITNKDIILGTVWVKVDKSAHALNWFIDEHDNINYIEPQTSKIFSLEQGKLKGYIPYYFRL